MTENDKPRRVERGWRVEEDLEGEKTSLGLRKGAETGRKRRLRNLVYARVNFELDFLGGLWGRVY